MVGMKMKSSNAIGFFRKVGDPVLGSGASTKHKHVAKRKKEKPSRRSKQEVPRILKGFFQSRHAGWPEYIMLKAQLAIVGLFVTAVVYLVFLPSETFIFIALLFAFSAYLIQLTVTQLRSAFERDYPAYRSFVVMCMTIAWVFFLVLKFSQTNLFPLENIQLAMIPPLITIGFVAVSFVMFRFKYGRNFTYAMVEETHGNYAVVRVGYDIRSNTKAGLYTVENFAKAKRGDIAKVSVERPMLGLRGASVKAVLEKAK